MAVAVLHDEFALRGARGGVCATGEIIVGNASNSSSYGFNRMVVFDPVSKTADTYEITMSGSVEVVGPGCGFNGGVAMVAGTASFNRGILVGYPDGTYDILGVPFSGGAASWMLVNDGTQLVAVRTGASSAPQVFTSGVGWSAGSTSVDLFTQPQMSGSVAVAITSAGDMVSIDMSTGNVTTLHSGVGAPAHAGYQAVLLGGRLWYPSSTSNLRGVRISDGNVVNIPVPTMTLGTGMGPIATDGTYLFVVNSGTAVYQVHPATFTVTAHTLPSPLGSTYAMFASGSKVWVPGSNPTS